MRFGIYDYSFVCLVQANIQQMKSKVCSRTCETNNEDETYPSALIHWRVMTCLSASPSFCHNPIYSATVSDSQLLMVHTLGNKKYAEEMDQERKKKESRLKHTSKLSREKLTGDYKCISVCDGSVHSCCYHWESDCQSQLACTYGHSFQPEKIMFLCVGTCPYYNAGHICCIVCECLIWFMTISRAKSWTAAPPQSLCHSIQFHQCYGIMIAPISAFSWNKHANT